MTASARTTGTRGIALLMVLWVITILMVIVFSFSALSRTETNAALGFREMLEKRNLAEAGVERGIMEIVYRKLKPKDVTEETWRTDGTRYSITVGEGHASVGIIDETGKIDLNMRDDASGIIMKNLLLLRGVPEDQADTIVDSLLDWKDTGDSDAHRLHGAETDYYETLPVPYSAKNANFDTVEELLLVKGMTPDILFGTRERKGIDSLLTVHGMNAQINVNFAPEDVLAAIPGIGADFAGAIVSERRSRDTALTAADLQTLLGQNYASAAPFITTAESLTFTIEASGHIADRAQAAHAIRATVTFSSDMGNYRYVYYKTPVTVTQ
jgi:general secretion pathway protein K